MSTRTYFFPDAVPDYSVEDLVGVLNKNCSAMYRVIEKASRAYARTWCPVCQLFVPQDEIHFTDGRTCNKIVNLFQ